MNKSKVFVKILVVTVLLLIVPLLGNIFVEGWNWGFFDFVFAAFYLIIVGSIYGFGVSKIKNRSRRTIVGFLVALVFVSIWVMLATG